jgi:hypothetical protein
LWMIKAGFVSSKEAAAHSSKQAKQVADKSLQEEPSAQAKPVVNTSMQDDRSKQTKISYQHKVIQKEGVDSSSGAQTEGA